MNMALLFHDHVVHFYTLHGLDWCDIMSALKADPIQAAKLSFKYSPYPINTGAGELKAVQKRLNDFAKGGSLGLSVTATMGIKPIV